MLVLSRQQNESIVIDGSIVVTIVEIRGDRVRLGIEAPPEIAVHRQEVQELLRRQSRRREASTDRMDEPTPSVDTPPSTGSPAPFFPANPPATPHTPNPSAGIV